jgi:hypothetical protein
VVEVKIKKAMARHFFKNKKKKVDCAVLTRSLVNFFKNLYRYCFAID